MPHTPALDAHVPRCLDLAGRWAYPEWTEDTCDLLERLRDAERNCDAYHEPMASWREMERDAARRGLSLDDIPERPTDEADEDNRCAA